MREWQWVCECVCVHCTHSSMPCCGRSAWRVICAMSFLLNAASIPKANAPTYTRSIDKCFRIDAQKQRFVMFDWNIKRMRFFFSFSPCPRCCQRFSDIVHCKCFHLNLVSSFIFFFPLSLPRSAVLEISSVNGRECAHSHALTLASAAISCVIQ